LLIRKEEFTNEYYFPEKLDFGGKPLARFEAILQNLLQFSLFSFERDEEIEGNQYLLGAPN